MPEHKVGTREEWLAARVELLETAKELTRRGDELARRRQELPWVRIEKDYRFETGEASLGDLFGGRSQLLVYHFMFPGCSSYATVADSFDGFTVHLKNLDVAFACVSNYPIEQITAFEKRMGWSFPWVSSLGSDFNYDFGVSYSDEQLTNGAEHNFTTYPPGRPGEASQRLSRHVRVRSGGRRRLPHLLGLHSRRGRPQRHVPVAGSRRQRMQRERTSYPVVSTSRRVRR